MQKCAGNRKAGFKCVAKRVNPCADCATDVEHCKRKGKKCLRKPNKCAAAKCAATRCEMESVQRRARAPAVSAREALCCGTTPATLVPVRMARICFHRMHAAVQHGGGDPRA